MIKKLPNVITVIRLLLIPVFNMFSPKESEETDNKEAE